MSILYSPRNSIFEGVTNTPRWLLSRYRCASERLPAVSRASYSDHLNGVRVELLNTITNPRNHTFRSETDNQTFTYDALGRVEEIICAVITMTSSAIDYHYYTLNEGHMVRPSFIGGTIKSEKVANSQPCLMVEYDYNLAGNMSWQIYPSGREVTIGYDDVGRVINMESTFESMLKLNYNYGAVDDNGNVERQTIAVSTFGTSRYFTVTQRYEYDALNRLRKVQETNGYTSRDFW